MRERAKGKKKRKVNGKGRDTDPLQEINEEEGESRIAPWKNSNVFSAFFSPSQYAFRPEGRTSHCGSYCCSFARAWYDSCAVGTNDLTTH